MKNKHTEAMAAVRPSVPNSPFSSLFPPRCGIFRGGIPSRSQPHGKKQFHSRCSGAVTHHKSRDAVRKHAAADSRQTAGVTTDVPRGSVWRPRSDGRPADGSAAAQTSEWQSEARFWRNGGVVSYRRRQRRQRRRPRRWVVADTSVCTKELAGAHYFLPNGLTWVSAPFRRVSSRCESLLTFKVFAALTITFFRTS